MIYTLGKDIFLKICEIFFSDRVTIFVAYFGLYESSLHF